MNMKRDDINLELTSHEVGSTSQGVLGFMDPSLSLSLSQTRGLQYIHEEYKHCPKEWVELGDHSLPHARMLRSSLANHPS